jgi:hypothetical protein
VVASRLYPGNTLSQHVLKEAVWTLERVLGVGRRQRSQVCLRLDAGFGTDDNLKWVLAQGYQLVAKNNSGRRAGAWGLKVQDWQVIDPDRRWCGLPPHQLTFSVPTRTIAVRWRDAHKHTLKHALYVVTDLERPLLEVCHLYDLRGGAEIEIRNDKQGLLLTHRRKRLWCAQEVLVLLTDLAHNFLSMFRRRVLHDTPLAGFGSYRLIQNVLNIPGEIVMDADRLVEVRFLRSHPYANILAEVLGRLWI